jgi:hypothetical protein
MSFPALVPKLAPTVLWSGKMSIEIEKYSPERNYDVFVPKVEISAR